MKKVKSFNLFESNINNYDLDNTISHMISNCRGKESPDLKGILMLFDLIPSDMKEFINTLFNTHYYFVEYLEDTIYKAKYNINDVRSLIKILLDNGIDINKKADDGYTLLENSLNINDEKIFRLVLDYNPDLYGINNTTGKK